MTSRPRAFSGTRRSFSQQAQLLLFSHLSSENSEQRGEEVEEEKSYH
jgi:hypothetical protein